MNMAITAGRRLGLLQLQLRDAVEVRLADDRGEGVISMALAILIVAFLGVGMWIAFKGFADDVSKEAEDQIKKIGDG